jgi:NADH:ubiquinone reductase (H+-translocating)
MTRSILIPGAGFAGFWAAMAARRVAGDEVDVTMISPAPILQMRPRLYEANPETLCLDISDQLETVGVRFVQGLVDRLDAGSQEVALKSGETISYDRLVLATGSQMRRPAIPGAGDAWSIDTVEEAASFDDRLKQIADHQAATTFAVVGAGFTGIELALELRGRLEGHGHDSKSFPVRILLVDQASEVGPKLGQQPRPVIQAALADANIELQLGVAIEEMSALHVSLSGGEKIDADAVILSTGLVAAPLASQVPGHKDGQGRVLVDEFLRAPSASEIFVAGDGGAADTGNGRMTLMSCQHALQTGRFAGENAARDLLEMPLVPYAQPRYVTCLDLGASGAVFTNGWDREVMLTGAEAKARKQMINQAIIYPPSDATAAELLAMSSVSPEKQGRPAAR